MAALPSVCRDFAHGLWMEREDGEVEPEALDYPETLARLTTIPGRQVEVTLRGTYDSPPVFLDFAGALQRTDQIEDPEAIGWDPDAFRLGVGEARITLHPNQFVETIHTPTPHGGWLKVVMGQVEIDFHY